MNEKKMYQIMYTSVDVPRYQKHLPLAEQIMYSFKLIDNDNSFKLMDNSTIIDSQKHVIPEWIRSNAVWWAEGSIDDQLVIQGIQFLIKTGIIKI